MYTTVQTAWPKSQETILGGAARFLGEGEIEKWELESAKCKLKRGGEWLTGGRGGERLGVTWLRGEALAGVHSALW